ncbi:MAG: small subunit ribosomal protein [Acidobacteriota bacterium]|nr:small subunit ribosomal protein [Acidobacteriota bacterium]
MRLDIQKEDEVLAEKRVYEVVFIIDTDTPEGEATSLVENLQKIVTDQGGTFTRSESMGRRHLAYNVGRKTEGNYWLFEIEGTGAEIAELERRMRVSDAVLRYLTVRVDEDRQRAEKLGAKRALRASKRPPTGSRGGGRSSTPPAFIAPPAAAAEEDEA